MCVSGLNGLYRISACGKVLAPGDAHTRESQLQVELAQYEYRLPRLTRLWTHIAGQAGGCAGDATGGVDLRGPGETQLESDRRLIRRHIARLKAGLEPVQEHQACYRRKRRRAAIPTVAIVGYTNAGKSTLLSALSWANVLVADILPTPSAPHGLSIRSVIL